MADADQLNSVQQELNKAIDAYRTGDGDLVKRTEVIGKAKELIRHVMEPSDYTMQLCANMPELTSFRTLRELDVLNKLPSEGSISLKDLAAATGVQDSLLERLLRMAVVTGFVEQTEDMQYKHTKFSKTFCGEPCAGDWFQFMYDECLKTLVHFHEYLTVVRKDLREPDDQKHSPFTARHNQDGATVWDIQAQFPKRQRTFQLGLAYAEQGFPVLGMYDFSQLASENEDRAAFVDVGGGMGSAIAAILEACPQLQPSQMVLEDLPPVLEHVKAGKTVPDGVKVIPHDFWTPQPVQGAKAYYVRRIMHDYSDEHCVEILKHIRDAMAADSMVLISEMLLPKKVDEAGLSATMMDNFMMSMGGKERTEEQFRQLLLDAGLELVKVWTLKDGPPGVGVVEGRKV